MTDSKKDIADVFCRTRTDLCLRTLATFAQTGSRYVRTRTKSGVVIGSALVVASGAMGAWPDPSSLANVNASVVDSVLRGVASVGALGAFCGVAEGIFRSVKQILELGPGRTIEGPRGPLTRYKIEDGLKSALLSGSAAPYLGARRDFDIWFAGVRKFNKRVKDPVIYDKWKSGLFPIVRDLVSFDADATGPDVRPHIVMNALAFGAAHSELLVREKTGNKKTYSVSPKLFAKWLEREAENPKSPVFEVRYRNYFLPIDPREEVLYMPGVSNPMFREPSEPQCFFGNLVETASQSFRYMPLFAHAKKETLLMCAQKFSTALEEQPAPIAVTDYGVAPIDQKQACRSLFDAMCAAPHVGHHFQDRASRQELIVALRLSRPEKKKGRGLLRVVKPK